MAADEPFVQALKRAAGAADVLTAAGAMRPFRTGFRGDTGFASAVVRPRSLVGLWRVLQECVAGRKAIILQAANTGLTGGSTPAVSGYDRDVVIISTTRIRGVFPVEGGRQAICLPGATLVQLERALAPWGREPHSVLGSTCFGASVIGGICNNSGGSLIRRGPAYTEMALYAQISAEGELELVNHLGIRLGADPERDLARLERGEFELETQALPARGSDRGYLERIRDIEAREPARYNEDVGRLFEASGCAGKVAVFAVRVDTFAKDRRTRTFYIGTNQPETLTEMRQRILTRFASLPVSAEYIHRTAFDMADRYGKEIFLAMRLLGTRWLPLARSLQVRLDARRGTFGWRVARGGSRALNSLANRLPKHLPRRVLAYRHRFEHHLLLKVAEEGIDQVREYLGSRLREGRWESFECTESESRKAFLHRFVVAGAAQRFLQLQRLGIEAIVSIDVALRPRDANWSSVVPSAIQPKVHSVLCYGHFVCHVFHLDYLIRRKADAEDVREHLKAWFRARGARYPAEHNVGHLYQAGPELVSFYRKLDPTNSFNPGIGQTSMKRNWV